MNKELIIAAIRAKFPAVNLTTKRIDAIAAKLETKITDDSQIDAQIDAFNDFNPIDEIAKNDDKIADYKNKLKIAATPQKEKIETETEAEQPPNEMLTLLKEMRQELTTLKGEKIQETFTSKAKADLADVPAQIWKGRTIPQDEEAYKAFVAEVKIDHADLIQMSTNNGLSLLTPPIGGNGLYRGGQKIDQGLKNYLEKQNAEALAIQSKPHTGYIQ